MSDDKRFYNCAAVANLPYGGAEVLFMIAFALYLLNTVMSTFLDLTLNQLWPAKYLDPAVQARIAEIQKQFPGIVATDGKTYTVVDDDGRKIAYDAVAAPEAYIATKSVDSDLAIIMANGKSFTSISGYCSSTVRGYVILSTFLIGAALSTAFLHVHNAMVDLRTNAFLGDMALVGYLCLTVTGIIMTWPETNAVYRQANICLVSNIPLVGPASKWLKLHILGVSCFILVPLVAHTLEAWRWGSANMPNYWTTLTCCWVVCIFGTLFALCMNAPALGMKLFRVNSREVGALTVLFEALTLCAAFIEFIQFEYYATAVCAGHQKHLNTLLMATMFGPFVVRLLRGEWTVLSYTQPPAVMLMYKGVPVATSGSCPALAFDQLHAVPHICRANNQCVAQPAAQAVSAELAPAPPVWRL
jgi:hypothetical protein